MGMTMKIMHVLQNLFQISILILILQELFEMPLYELK